MSDGPDPRREGVLLAGYLAGGRADPDAVARYEEATRVLGLDADPLTRKLWRQVDRRPELLKFVDAGLGLAAPGSTFRSQILLMTAILEASPLHADDYLARPRSPTYLLRIAVLGVAAAAKAAVGVLVVQVAGRTVGGNGPSSSEARPRRPAREPGASR